MDTKNATRPSTLLPTSQKTAEVAVFIWKLTGTYTYLCPAEEPDPRPGSRVLVPFGKREALGLVLRCDGLDDPGSRELIEEDGGQGGLGPDGRAAYEVRDSVPTGGLRELGQVLDRDPSLDPATLRLARFTADYYRMPSGRALEWSLPPQLRRLEPRKAPPIFCLADEEAALPQPEMPSPRPSLPPLTDEQAQVARELQALPEGFSQTLIEGVTGSGKTLLYCQRIAAALQAGRQVLYLVPEIAIAHAMAARLSQYFGLDVPVRHSSAAGSNSKLAHQQWLQARLGRLPLLVGTRSTLFTPMPKLGLIVVDEEHDSSYHQDGRNSYSGRDLAIMRGQIQQVPVLLGSATPSLDSLHRVHSKGCGHLHLRGRPLAVAPPKIHLVGRTRTEPGEMLSPQSCTAVERALEQDAQAMVFLDLRGYARGLACSRCDWVSLCPQCEMPQVWHRARGMVLCHNCGALASRLQAGGGEQGERRDGIQLEPGGEAPPCPRCLGPVQTGAPGTEAMAEWCAGRFPHAEVVRLDRDAAETATKARKVLAAMHEAAPGILVGTRMIAKGHHLPKLRVVVVPNANLGLHHPDFRSAERWAQLLVQAVGRAGREGERGQVFLEAADPANPLMRMAQRADYQSMAQLLMDQRRRSHMPPFAHLIAVHAEAIAPALAEKPLRAVAELMGQVRGVRLVGPMPGVPERLRRHHRMVLHLIAAKRGQLHPWLPQIEEVLHQQGRQGRLNWHLEVDPGNSL